MTRLLAKLDRAHTLVREAQRAGWFGLDEADGGAGAVYQAADRFRRDLARLEVGAVGDLLDVWDTYRGRLTDRLARLTAELAGIPDGLPVPEVLQQAQVRAEEHLAQVEAILRDYTDRVEGVTGGRMDDAGRQAADDAKALADLQLGPSALEAGVSFNRLPDEAVTQLVGAMRTGPLANLLDALAGELAGEWRTELAQGLSRGLSPRDVGARMGRLVDVPRWRTLTIARTETLRAYREATRRSMTANRRVVQGWRWSSALDTRTCAMCWAMHGTLHDNDEVMGTHPNCRCSMAPQTVPMADLVPGVDDGPSLHMTAGPDLFASRPPAFQLAVLGPAKFQAYTDGLIGLPDLVGTGMHPLWGPTRTELPLSAVLDRGPSGALVQ